MGLEKVLRAAILGASTLVAAPAYAAAGEIRFQPYMNANEVRSQSLTLSTKDYSLSGTLGCINPLSGPNNTLLPQGYYEQIIILNEEERCKVVIINLKPDQLGLTLTKKGDYRYLIAGRPTNYHSGHNIFPLEVTVSNSKGAKDILRWKLEFEDSEIRREENLVEVKEKIFFSTSKDQSAGSQSRLGKHFAANLAVGAFAGREFGESKLGPAESVTAQARFSGSDEELYVSIGGAVTFYTLSNQDFSGSVGIGEHFTGRTLRSGANVEIGLMGLFLGHQVGHYYPLDASSRIPLEFSVIAPYIQFMLDEIGNGPSVPFIDDFQISVKAAGIPTAGTTIADKSNKYNFDDFGGKIGIVQVAMESYFDQLNTTVGQFGVAVDGFFLYVGGIAPFTLKDQSQGRKYQLDPYFTIQGGPKWGVSIAENVRLEIEPYARRTFLPHGFYFGTAGLDVRLLFF